MKRWKRLLLLGAAIIVLPAVAVVAHWQYYVYLTNAELDRIRAAGEPVTFGELREHCRIAAGDYPHHEDWLAVFDEMQLVEQADQEAHVALFEWMWDDDNTDIGSGPNPWIEREHTDAVLKRYEKAILLIETAARRRAPVRWSFTNMDAMMELRRNLEEIRYLLLFVTWAHIQHGETWRSPDDLLLLFALSPCLEYTPDIIGTIYRRAFDFEALNRTIQMLSAVDLPDSDLQTLQATIRGIGYENHQRLALLHERVRGFQAIEALPARSFFGFRLHRENTILRWSPRTRLAYLSSMRGMIEAAKLDWPQVRSATIEVNRRLGKPVESPLIGLKLLTVEDLMGQWPNFLGAGPRGFSHAVACGGATDAAIAVELYRRRHDRLPQSLEQLVPQFLPSVPSDPIDGQPLRYRVEQEAIAIYSIGDDEKDERAAPEAIEQQRDWGYRIPFKERP